MPRDHRINIRIGTSHVTVQAIAATLVTEATATTTSDVYRTLLAEALTARTRDCTAGHHGPIRASTCGHCGRPA